MAEYPKICLVGPCREEFIKAAVYDYVGAVYDYLVSDNPFNINFPTETSAAPSYDGVLTKLEEKEVKEKFGEITSLDQVANYLSTAKAKFFSGFFEGVEEPGDCQNSLATRKLSSSSWGHGFIMAGLHWCYKDYLDQFEKIELQVASNPEQWLFILEGSEEVTKYSSPFEIPYFIQLAEKLRIPVTNTIPRISNPQVLEEFRKKGYEPIDVVTAFAYQAYLSYQNDYIGALRADGFLKADGRLEGMTNKEMNTGLDNYLNAAVEQMAQNIPVTTQEVKEKIRSFLKDRTKQPEEHEKSVRIVRYYEDIANRLLIGVTREALKKSGRPNALIISGSKHLSAFERVYQE